ncbi:avidin family protein [Nitrosospira multiformis]|uniref:Avidin family protein n=1 Tax=Nitrosospira multiformis TaxID=1231 RepID=A0A2T5IH34_9PROT|nr:avidin/streptavidin family protein [Nitrosospira multiformis]PTQ83140.1 avidin family protein [Nitrosospira multiformis]
MNFLGIWENQHGSILNISHIDPLNGLIEGQYKTAVGKPDASQAYELKGYVRENLIGFTVSYGEIDCICCWVGRLELDNKIHTLWQYVSSKTIRKNPDNNLAEEYPSDLWQAFHVQADIFTRKA